MGSDRMERAWRRCRDWITEYDGSVTEACFLDIPGPRLRAGLQAIADQIPCEPGDLAPLAVDHVTREPGFELRLRLLVDHTEAGLFDVTAVWWADQVFPTGSDPFGRFRALLAYLCALQASLGSPCLLIGPENCADPRTAPSPWIEI